MKEQSNTPFFVYGTLREGEYNFERILKDISIDEIKPALVTGTLYSVNDSFPALVRAPMQPGGIKGDLIYVNDLDYNKALRAMDALEGYNPKRPEDSRNMYRRIMTWVYDEQAAELVDAYVYFWNRSVKGMQQIDTGDWKSYFGNVRQRESRPY